MNKITITAALNAAALAMIEAGKTPWIVAPNGAVASVHTGRAQAREAAANLFSAKVAKFTDVELDVLAEATPLDAPKVEKAPKAKKSPLLDAEKAPAIPMLRASTIEKPTKQVWHIADELKAKGITSRKLVIAECVARGIAFYTARTQYQQWKQLDVKSPLN